MCNGFQSFAMTFLYPARAQVQDKNSSARERDIFSAWVLRNLVLHKRPCRIDIPNQLFSNLSFLSRGQDFCTSAKFLSSGQTKKPRNVPLPRNILYFLSPRTRIMHECNILVPRTRILHECSRTGNSYINRLLNNWLGVNKYFSWHYLPSGAWLSGARSLAPRGSCAQCL